MTSALTLPEQKFQTPLGALELRAAELGEVSDQSTLERAAQLRREIKGWLDGIEADCAPTVRRAYELHRDLVARRKRLEEPFLEIEAELKRKCNHYVAAQRRIIEQRAAEEEAAARLAREEAKAQAQALKEAGQLELAGVIEQEAEQIVPPPPLPLPQAPGMTVSEVWKAEVVDWQAFLVGVLEGVVPREAIEVTALLGRQARALKSELRWPGVRVWSETSTGRRG